MGRPRELSQEERDDLMRRGYRPVEIWVPDTTTKAYREDAARQAQASVEADRQADLTELIDPGAAEGWDKP